MQTKEFFARNRFLIGRMELCRLNHFLSVCLAYILKIYLVTIATRGNLLIIFAACNRSQFLLQVFRPSVGSCLLQYGVPEFLPICFMG